ncbi:MAG: Asp-tRNA(Asn)/Glu-tRNA(Gln) amidotransferase subunit GatC [Candidatus Saccharibacteria bacterium]|nr:Asp-tRNA(Asn)/Glu-tRNA(Gln) amidotransferase subunit GatC [Candidatus Saccharibacteria bacterium]
MSSKNAAKFTEKQVAHIAQLAQIPITTTEQKNLADDFSETLQVIAELQTVPVAGIEPTHHVTGLSNVTREDRVTAGRMLTQEQALANAKRTYQGYFVVPRIIDRDA